MSEPDYKAAAHLAFEGIAARTQVSEPSSIFFMPEEEYDRYLSKTQRLLERMLGSAIYSILPPDFHFDLGGLLEQVYLAGARDSEARFEKYLTEQARAQTRGMLSGLLRASHEEHDAG